jgi:hypothetical protein
LVWLYQELIGRLKWRSEILQMLFDEFDRELVRQLFQAAREGNDAVFYDPKYPYQVSIRHLNPTCEITVEDVRKRWWGRVVSKRRTMSKPAAVGLSSTQGPAFEALMALKRAIEAGNR